MSSTYIDVQFIMLLPQVIHNCKVIFTSTIVHESRYRISFYSVQLNNSQAMVDPQFHRSKYKFNNVSIIYNVYSSKVKMIMRNESWTQALRCASIDKGYSMFIGCQSWAVCKDIVDWVVPWVPRSQLWESETEPHQTD